MTASETPPVAGALHGALHGALYDGAGRLLWGEGPEFTLELLTGFAFQAVLHNLDEPGNRVDAEDRIWILPDRDWGAIAPGEHLLAGLAATVQGGRKVLVMAHDTETGDLACEAVEAMLNTPHGHA